ncbi:hypothetical protein ALC56_05099 [Trachymyrmex septentrionalis]|uniref:Uncharacterized protein n=1 Tax=Trachymyrmex septentrionalis TaxID=34720 RepID=A0A195FIF3_9HYME|nr:hypothetical protein ALC56_05099 [Trachymyrmex septentrionalis]
MKRKREGKTISGGVGTVLEEARRARGMPRSFLLVRHVCHKGAVPGCIITVLVIQLVSSANSGKMHGKIASPVDFTLGRNVSNRSSIYDSFVSGINPEFEGCYAPGFRVFLRSTRNDQTMCAILIAHCVHVALMWLDQLADVHALSSATGVILSLYAWPPTMRKLESNSLTHDEGENKTDSTLLRMMAPTLKEKIGCCSKLDVRKHMRVQWVKRCCLLMLTINEGDTQECNEIIDTAAGCNPTTSRGLLLHIVNGTRKCNYAVRYLDLPASSSWFFFVPRRGALISSSRAVAELDDSGGGCRGYTQLSPRIEQRASVASRLWGIKDRCILHSSGSWTSFSSIRSKYLDTYCVGKKASPLCSLCLRTSLWSSGS